MVVVVWSTVQVNPTAVVLTLRWDGRRWDVGSPAWTSLMRVSQRYNPRRTFQLTSDRSRLDNRTFLWTRTGVVGVKVRCRIDVHPKPVRMTSRRSLSQHLPKWTDGCRCTWRRWWLPCTRRNCGCCRCWGVRLGGVMQRTLIPGWWKSWTRWTGYALGGRAAEADLSLREVSRVMSGLVYRAYRLPSSLVFDVERRGRGERGREE